MWRAADSGFFSYQGRSPAKEFDWGDGVRAMMFGTLGVDSRLTADAPTSVPTITKRGAEAVPVMVGRRQSISLLIWRNFGIAGVIDSACCARFFRTGAKEGI
jgi:hypothetical protein